MMKKNSLTNLDDEALRQSFRKHTFRGLFVSLTLMVLFFIIYFAPLNVQPTLISTLIFVIAVVSVVLAIWYHMGRRSYYKEFRRRNMRIRG